MMRRWRGLLMWGIMLLFVTLALLLILDWLLLPWLLPDQVNETNYRRIHPGMTVGEVEEVLGTWATLAEQHTDPETGSVYITQRWGGDEKIIWVNFRLDGKATRVWITGNRSARPNPWMRLRRLLGK